MNKKSFVYGLAGSAAGFFIGLFFYAGTEFLFLMFGLLIGGAYGRREDVFEDVLHRVDAARLKVELVKKDEKKSRTSRLLVEEWLKERAESKTVIPQSTVDIVMQLIDAYVAQALNLIEALARACRSTPLEHEILQILRKTCLKYFEDEEAPLTGDVGIAGYLDDAFGVQYAVEKIASWEGSALSAVINGSVELQSANAFVEALLPQSDSLRVKALAQKALNASLARQKLIKYLARTSKMQSNWGSAISEGGIDFKKEMIKDDIYHNLAKDGIFLRH